MDLRELKFGIEIETIRRTRQAVAEAIRTVVGGAVRHVGYPSSYDPWEVTEPRGRVWEVVADTQHHRILRFDADSRRLKGQLGDTDKPGAGLRAFDRPTCLCIRGNRLAVYDAGNQRIIKAELAE
jgi:hypothetical protein